MSKHCIFDLDGTLIDSSPSILESYSKAFETTGFVPCKPFTSDIIGPPLMQTLSELAGTDEPAVLDKLAVAFKRHYDYEGYKKTFVYPGIEPLLTTLAQQGVRLYIATNKRLLPTTKILQHLGWQHYFQGVFSLDFYQPPLQGKSQMVGQIISDFRLDKSKTAYVGDRYEDGVAAGQNGIVFVMVTWGYRDYSLGDTRPEWCLSDTPENLINHFNH